MPSYLVPLQAWTPVLPCRACRAAPARQHAVRNCLKVDQPTHRPPLKQRPIRMSHAFLMLLYLVYFIPGLLDSTRSHLIYWTLLDPAKSHLRANAQSDRSVRAAPYIAPTSLWTPLPVTSPAPEYQARCSRAVTKIGSNTGSLKCLHTPDYHSGPNPTGNP